MQLDAHHVDPRRHQRLELRGAGQQLGAHVHGTHARLARHAHERRQVRVAHRVAEPREGHHHVARLPQLRQDAFHERRRHRTALHRAVAVRAGDAVGEPARACLDDDVLRHVRRQGRVLALECGHDLGPSRACAALLRQHGLDAAAQADLRARRVEDRAHRREARGKRRVHHPARRAAQVVVPLAAQPGHRADGGAGAALGKRAQRVDPSAARREPGGRVAEDDAAPADRLEAPRHVLDPRAAIHQDERPVAADHQRAVQAPRLERRGKCRRRQHLVEHGGAADATAPHRVAPQPADGDGVGLGTAQRHRRRLHLDRHALRARARHRGGRGRRVVGEHHDALDARRRRHARHRARQHRPPAELALQAARDARPAGGGARHHHRRDAHGRAHLDRGGRRRRARHAARQRKRPPGAAEAADRIAHRHDHGFRHGARAAVDHPKPCIAVGGDEGAHAPHRRIVELAALDAEPPFKRRKREERVELRAPGVVERRAARMPRAVDSQRVDADQHHGIASRVPQQPVRALLRAADAERPMLRGIAAALAGQAHRALPPASRGRLEHGRHDERGAREQAFGKLPQHGLEVRLLDPEHRRIRRHARGGKRPQCRGGARQHEARPRRGVRERRQRVDERRPVGREHAERSRARTRKRRDALLDAGGGRERAHRCA